VRERASSVYGDATEPVKALLERAGRGEVDETDGD
jgi:hypothetical protein